jgi:hypothetical protein
MSVPATPRKEAATAVVTAASAPPTTWGTLSPAMGPRVEGTVVVVIVLAVLEMGVVLAVVEMGVVLAVVEVGVAVVGPVGVPVWLRGSGMAPNEGRGTIRAGTGEHAAAPATSGGRRRHRTPAKEPAPTFPPCTSVTLFTVRRYCWTPPDTDRARCQGAKRDNGA